MKALSFTETGNPKGWLVIFIHGGFTSSESFQKQYHLLPTWHCLFVDLPEYGNSRDCGAFSFADAANGVISLMEQFSPRKKVVLISHSYGGLVVKKILETCPERVKKVVIGSTNLKRTPLFYLYTRRLGCLVLQHLNKERYQKEQITWKLICHTQADAWKNFTLPQTTFPNDLPALLLYADHDAREIIDSMKIWNCYFPNARLVEIKDSDHIYFWNHAEEVNQLIKEFLY